MNAADAIRQAVTAGEWDALLYSLDWDHGV